MRERASGSSPSMERRKKRRMTSSASRAHTSLIGFEPCILISGLGRQDGEMHLVDGSELGVGRSGPAAGEGDGGVGLEGVAEDVEAGVDGHLARHARHVLRVHDGQVRLQGPAGSPEDTSLDREEAEATGVGWRT